MFDRHRRATHPATAVDGLPDAARQRNLAVRACTYITYVPNKTISVPDDVVPIIDQLGEPFSRWVTEQLRRHAANSTLSFADQLLADAKLAADDHTIDKAAVGRRMQRSAPW